MRFAILQEFGLDFRSLFFPNVCASCGRHLLKGEETLCVFCEHFLPRTGFHDDPENPVFKMFWGRTEVQMAASFLYFNKGTRVQRLLHRLKYHGRQDVGLHLGRMYGRELGKSEYFRDVDLVIPVPLHRSRLRQRGYNQSDCFAEGMALSMKCPWNNEVLFRERRNPSQTHRKRYDRWENVSGIFNLRNAHHISGKHVLLADDVVTTGSTLDACVQTLLRAKDVRVSVATIACTIKI